MADAEHALEDALRRARAFVARSGDAADRIRVDALLGLRPPRDAEQALSSRREAASADPEAAAELFEALSELRLLRGALAAECSKAVERLQRADGSWCAGGAQADAGPLLPLGLEGHADALFLTALLGGFLGLTGAALETTDVAGAWLAARWSPDLVQSGSWHAIASLLHFFANVDHELGDEVLQWCGRELERGFRSGAIDALHTARAFVLCEATSLPGARLSGREVLEALLASQDEGGGFPSRPGGPPEVAATLHAVAALTRLGSWRRGTLAAG
jgi:hypothetical protein